VTTQPNPDPATNTNDADGVEQSKVSFVQAMLSVIQASFGVQSSHNRERDFTKGKLWIFIASALLFTVVFVLTIAAVVTMVLSQ